MNKTVYLSIIALLLLLLFRAGDSYPLIKHPQSRVRNLGCKAKQTGSEDEPPLRDKPALPPAWMRSSFNFQTDDSRKVLVDYLTIFAVAAYVKIITITSSAGEGGRGAKRRTYSNYAGDENRVSIAAIFLTFNPNPFCNALCSSQHSLAGSHRRPPNLSPRP
jgi:hypothetical protein